jgi:hypothetical protein
MPVALLTGRVYQDGLGGLRAVLFIFTGNRRHPVSDEPDMRSLSYAMSRSANHECARFDINHG